MTDSEKTVRNISSANVWNTLMDKLDLDLKSIQNNGKCITLGKKEAEKILKKYKN